MNFLSGLFFIIGYFPYALAIINGVAIPSVVSWVIWISIDVLALIAMKKKKVACGQLTGAVIGGSIVMFLAIAYGDSKIGSVEIVSIVIAALGVLIWQIKKDAIFGIIFSQISTFAGSIPTLINVYENPAREDPIAWSIWLVSCIFALFAIKKWNMANALQPLNFTVVNATMVVLVLIRPMFF